LVDLRAPSGAAGSLLLDPTDITIEVGDSSGDMIRPTSAPFTITGSNPTSFLSVTDLQNELGLGNVTVSTSSSAAAPLGGTITVASAVSWSNSNSLTLAADRSVLINAPIASAAGTLILTAAGGNITQSASISVAALSASAPNGAVALSDAGNAIATVAGSAGGSGGFSLANSAALTVGGIASTAGPIAVNAAGNIDVTNASAGINAGGNAVVLRSGGSVTTSAGTITGSTLEINAATGVGSLGIPLSTSVGSLQVTNSTSGDISVSNTGSALTIADIGSLGYGIQQTGSGNIYIASDNALTVSGAIQVQGAAGNVGLQAANGIAIAGPVTVNTANGVIALRTAGADISQSAGSVTAASVSAVASNGSVQMNDATNAIGTIAGVANGTSGFSLTNGGEFTVGTVPAVGNIPAVTGIASSSGLGYAVVLETLNVGDITLNAPVNAGSGTVLITAAGAVAQGSGGLITADTLGVDSGGAAGIGSRSAPLLSDIGTLATVNSQGPVYINDSAGLTVTGISALGAVNVNSGGSLSTPTVAECDCSRSLSGSAVTLTAHGSMLINAGSAIMASGPVALYAGYDAAGGTYVGSPNTLTVNGSVSGASIGLFAGGAIAVAGTLTGSVTQMPSLYSPPTPPPRLEQCAANPTLPGCSSVLPPVAGALPVINSANTLVNSLNVTTGTVSVGSGEPESSDGGSGGTSSKASTESTSTTHPGATDNGAAKKMYCN
jgi:hypothetical protein